MVSRRNFINKQVCPPGGFVHVELPSGVEFRHIVFEEILKRVRLFRIANGIPLPPGWQEEVEDAMCARYEPSIWQYVIETPRTGKRSIRIGDVANFVRVVRAWMSEGRQFVPQEEAERRAAICRACPERGDIEGCTPCMKLLETVTGLLGGRATKYDAELKGCSVCSCSNQVQVHIPLDVLQKGITPDMQFPKQVCWKAPTL
jgi:hypothetical protein